MRTAYQISAALLAAILLCIAVFSMFAFFDTGTLVDEHEHRALEPFPAFTAKTWLGGGFAPGLGRYLTDHVMLRSELIPVTRELEKWMRVQTKIRVVDMTKPSW